MWIVMFFRYLRERWKHTTFPINMRPENVSHLLFSFALSMKKVALRCQ
jgi:hypothetical protein